MKSYREKFQTKLDEEISAFRERTLAQPAQEIYDDVYRIHFYEFMYDYLSSEEFTSKQYKAFLTAENKFINRLWNKALDCEEFNVGNSDDALFLVDEYMRDYAAHPVPPGSWSWFILTLLKYILWAMHDNCKPMP